MRKKEPTGREEMLILRTRIQDLEGKLAFTSEPLLIDALSYELLGLQSRMNYLFADAKAKEAVSTLATSEKLHKNL